MGIADNLQVKQNQDHTKLLERLVAEQQVTNRLLWTLLKPEQRAEYDRAPRT